jgi:hypothetical protein
MEELERNEWTSSQIDVGRTARLAGEGMIERIRLSGDMLTVVVRKRGGGSRSGTFMTTMDDRSALAFALAGCKEASYATGISGTSGTYRFADGSSLRYSEEAGRMEYIG